MCKRVALLPLGVFCVFAALIACGGTNSLSLDKSLTGENGGLNKTIKYGSMTDPRDGQVYKTVKIGNQVWMAENLNYKKPNKETYVMYGYGFNMVSDGYVEKTVYNYCYDGDASNCVKYGALYPWEAALKVCPSGWRLPDTTDWKNLISAIGENDSVGNKLKSTFGWFNNGNGSDDYGFSVFPAGGKGGPNRFGDFLTSEDEVHYFAKGKNAIFWTTTESPKETLWIQKDALIQKYDAFAVYLYYYKDLASVKAEKRELAFSVRCVENSTLESDSSSSVVDSQISKYSSSAPTVIASSSSRKIELDSIVDSRDGQTYKTVKIGEQIWMAQNLNFEKDDSYCRSDDAENCSKYGRLYSWSAAQDACPSGWYLPTEGDWKILLTKWESYILAGLALKASAGWYNDKNGKDAFGFSALPGGFRYVDGTYSADGENAFFWTSTEKKNKAYGMSLYYFDGAELSVDDKNIGMSVRCLKGERAVQSSSSSADLSNAKSSSSVASSNAVSGALIDSRDGRLYKTVTIGAKTWMAENLNYATVDSYCLQNNPNNCTKYGRLYTWAAAVDSVGLVRTKGKECGYDRACNLRLPVQGVCPAGWRLPSKDEWKTLVAGDSQKLRSKSGWLGTFNGTDDYGFNALPAGDKDDDGDFVVGYNAVFWTSSEIGPLSAGYMDLGRNKHSDYYMDAPKTRGFSVRCVRDDTQGSAPVLTPEPKTDSLKNVEGFLTDSRDGQTYRTVTIGSQTWMAENLNYKTKNSYCYGDSTGNCRKYGRYYKWEAVHDACPVDWHLPTAAEWDTLFKAVGGESLAGKVLRSAVGWRNCDSGWEHTWDGYAYRRDCGNGTDDYGFSVISAGYRNGEGAVGKKKGKKVVLPSKQISYYRQTSEADFWSSADHLYIYMSTEGNVEKKKDDSNRSLSIRCVKGTTTSNHKAKVYNKKKTANSPAFKPSRVITDSLIDNRDGQTYKTVTIGKQTWMAQNLNYVTSGSYCHDDNINECAKYGRLYKASAAVKSCPAGWHLPSEAEWKVLFGAVGGIDVAGSKLKSKNGWLHDGSGSDDYGFSALPVGLRDKDGAYSKNEIESNFWTSVKIENFRFYSYSGVLLHVHLDYVSSDVEIDSKNDRNAISVRCVKNSDEIMESSSSSAKSSSSQKINSSSSFVSPSSVVKDSLTDARDGQTYKTVTIGTQTWMAENLNYRTNENSFCYTDSLNQCKPYGRYYLLSAAEKACPTGWHLPSEWEWNILIQAMGGSYVAGRMLRSADGWVDSENDTDAYAFSARPNGFRDRDGNFKHENLSAYFWASSEESSSLNGFFALYGGIGSADVEKGKKAFDGLNVRCVKD